MLGIGKSIFSLVISGGLEGTAFGMHRTYGLRPEKGWVLGVGSVHHQIKLGCLVALSVLSAPSHIVNLN